jgi:hypothetical protein
MSTTSSPQRFRSRMALWIAIAILGAITLVSVLPPASSYRVANPTPQWVIGL